MTGERFDPAVKTRENWELLAVMMNRVNRWSHAITFQVRIINNILTVAPISNETGEIYRPPDAEERKAISNMINCCAVEMGVQQVNASGHLIKNPTHRRVETGTVV